jgi:electron transport complex protein RnfB
MIKISEITHREPKAMDATAVESKPKATAFIDEDLCIGCVLCIKACPVDAILGATKLMHTVIQQECTGCELCVPVCPVDCIEMRLERITTKNWKWPDPVTAALSLAEPLTERDMSLKNNELEQSIDKEKVL